MKDLKSVHIGAEEYFRINATTYPNADAVVEDDRTVSYGELDRMAARVASQLLKYDTCVEEPVGILLPKGTASIVAQIATIRIGGSCVPLDLAFPDQRIHKLFDNLKVRIVISNSAEQHRAPPHCSIILLDDISLGAKTDKTGINKRTVVRTGSDHRTHVLHTSGTTGEPKGVEILSQGIMYLANNTNVIDLRRTDRIAQVAAPSFDATLIEIWATLVVGGAIVVMSKDTLMDPYAMYEALQKHRITGIIMTPTLLQHIVAEVPHAFAGLDFVVTGGEPANPKVYQAIFDHGPPKMLVNGYGPTEATVVASWHKTQPADCLKPAIPIGTTVDGVTLSILDENQTPVEGTTIGELYIGGATVSRGYYNRPEVTAKRFIEIISSSGHKQRFFRTGDLARYTSDGQIDFIGRNDELVKILGKRIDVTEIKTVMMDSGLVVDSVILPISRPNRQTYLVAFVVSHCQGGLSTTDLDVYMRKFLPGYMIPRIQFVPFLPMTPHGKADKHLLTSTHISACEEAESQQYVSEPSSESTREWLEQKCNSLLGICNMNANSNFFDCGGSSMQAAAFLMHIRRKFSIQIKMQHIYDLPTLQDLSDFIEEATILKSTACASRIDQTKLDLLFVDSELANTIDVPHISFADPRLTDCNHVFLTGATGFLGIHLLRDMINRAEVKEVKCLVRAADASAGHERLFSLLKDIGVDHIRQLGKVSVVAGSLGEERFGLSLSEFSNLARWADTIFHVGAHINWSQPYQHHRAGNVIGTLDCIRFAVTDHVKPLHYVSSAAVSGPITAVSNKQIIMEDDDLMSFTKTLPFDIGYTQSKWVAEKMVQNMQRRGLPAVIYRPGFIMGDGVRGKVNHDDFMSRFYRSCFELGVHPSLPNQTKLVITPEYCSAAMVHISSNPANFGHVFHITPPTVEEDPDLEKVFSILSEIGYGTRAIPYKDWIELMITDKNMIQNPLCSLIPVLQEPVLDGRTRWELYENMAWYDVTNTQAALADMKYEHGCGIDRQFLINYMKALTEKA